MIKRVLAPFDGSDSSEGALSIALSVCRVTRAELVGLFVENQARFVKYSLPMVIAGSITGEPVVAGPLDSEELLIEEEKVKAEGEVLGRRFQEACKEAKVEGLFQITRGDPASLVVDVARGVDFVVMGNVGRHSRKDSELNGLTVQGVLRSTTRSVLVVPEDAEGESRIVIAYDGSPAADRALRAAAEFAELTELDDVHLLTVSATEEEGRELQRHPIAYLRAYDFHLTPTVLVGRVEQTIASYVKHVDASIVAVGAFGFNRLLDRVFGSTSTHLLDSVEVAVLLVP